jgi:hypothetical protein
VVDRFLTKSVIRLSQKLTPPLFQIMLERKDAFLSKGEARLAAGGSGRDACQGISEAAFEGVSDSEAFNAGGYTDSQAVEVDRMLMQMYNRA